MYSLSVIFLDYSDKKYADLRSFKVHLSVYQHYQLDYKPDAKATAVIFTDEGS